MDGATMYGMLPVWHMDARELLVGAAVTHCIYGLGRVERLDEDGRLVVVFAAGKKCFPFSSLGGENPEGEPFFVNVDLREDVILTFQRRVMQAQCERAEKEAAERASKAQEAAFAAAAQDLARRVGLTVEQLKAMPSDLLTVLKGTTDALKRERTVDASAGLALLEEIRRRQRWLPPEIDKFIAETYEWIAGRRRDPWLLIRASRWYRQAGAPERALAVCGRLDSASEQFSGKLASALSTTRGGALRQMGNAAEAEECARGALHLDDGAPHPWNLLGALYADRGDFGAAEAHFREAAARGYHASPEEQLRQAMRDASPELRRLAEAYLATRAHLQ